VVAEGAENVSLFSPEERQQVLDRILAALRTDSRIAGVVIVGSGAEGFEDGYSDLDLSVVVAVDDDVLPVYREWKSRIQELFPVVSCFQTAYGPYSYLYGFFLDNFLELDVGFLCLNNLRAKRGRWKVGFDRTGKIECIMQSSWAGGERPNIQEIYLSRLNSIWHYITHVVASVERGQPWRALHYLEEVRNRTVELAGLRRGLETRHFRQVDQLPEECRFELQQTLVSSTEATDIMRALRKATTCFFREAQALEETLGLTLASSLEVKLREYLDLFDEPR